MNRDMMNEMTEKARKASYSLAVMSRERKDAVLRSMADGIERSAADIKKANAIDVAAAREKGRTGAFVDRLELNDKRISGMCSMLREVAALEDPVGKVIGTTTRPNGLVIEKVRVPIGVIGIIYESRPNVTADCVSLCMKSGNAVILRGGSDAINSNKAIYDAMRRGAVSAGMDEGAFALVEDTSRDMVDSMLGAAGKIDLIMPRGGEALIREVTEKSRVPVIKHYKGICHVYVDKDANTDMAENICFNAKVQRPGVCNAMETMLVHKDIADAFLPGMLAKFAGAGVKIKGCVRTKKYANIPVGTVTDEDYATEWLDLVLNVKIVDSLDEAVGHIARFGSGHSDAIVTENARAAEDFLRRVDSSAVYVNASTRFTDGGEFGKGAEIGISTDRLHARGPMGLEELTTYKYVVRGTGQIRE
ncbi:MAG: glutamate-5-semialdehyde dehydrogenase [Candidatus Omnitrophica bacterium]|nr:glutamate-5-semialdehyde dehydrogenase [Candidatus Omnitrophota bacterium]MDD5488394.1 glutamate-5-semialdehyde dehydrogenase [Candidatus Omnitrophota bacterium]